MAFPVVEAVNGGGVDEKVSSHTISLPASIAADDLLLVFIASYYSYNFTFPEGWTQLFENTEGTYTSFGAWYRIADGEEGASITVTTPLDTTVAHTSFRISNYYGIPECGTPSYGADDNPDPPNLAPSWAGQEQLWIAACGYCDDGGVTTYPTNYSDGRCDVSDVNIYEAGIATARRELDAASENPGTFDLIDASTYWIANTVAIQGLQPVPDPSTNVSATDGDHTDKVVITWTQDEDAIDYQPYRDAVALGWLGDVATHDDEGADAPTITPGTTVASDGTYTDYVALSLSGSSANNGTSHTYKVVGRNANGVESGDSGTDTGYTGVGALTYQWQRSFGDADELYTSIVGATSSTHSDYGAPERGWGRYYQCILNATGAAQQISGENRGYRLAPVVPLLGTTRIDALDYMAQLGDETVLAYTATTKAANTIVGELIALQHNTPAITAGTIEYTATLSIDVPQDTILGVLMRMQEMLGGYMYVDNDRKLQWLEDIGSDTGQQIRYQKNLKGIRRTIDYSNFANRIYVYGDAGLDLADQVCQSQLVPGTDIGAKRWIADEWRFILAPDYWQVGCEYYYGGSVINKWGGGGRFLNIPLNQGDTINEAYLIFPDSNFSQTTVNSLIKGEDTDNAATFSTLGNYDGRDRTTASVEWNNIPSWGGGGERTSPDIKTVIQEIVDRPGWASGQAMVIFWDDHDGNSTLKSYNIRLGSLPPVLWISYLSSATDYLEDTVSQAQYGGIYTRTLINKAITDSATLNEWAQLKLLEMKDPYISYEIDMANLEADGLSFEALALGNIVRVIDEDLDINVTARVVKITRDLSNPMNIKVEIANKVRDVIDQLGRDFRWRNENY